MFDGVVPGVGFEPPLPFRKKDFKSLSQLAAGRVDIAESDRWAKQTAEASVHRQAYSLRVLIRAESAAGCCRRLG